MKKNKQTIDESLGKIKFMINYDSSRTLIENTIPVPITEQLDEPADPEVAPTNCENAIPIEEVERKLTQVANTVKKMNTAFMRMAKGDQRAKLIYRNLKSMAGMNVYDEDFNECRPVMTVVNELWPKLFRDWFSKGETLTEELEQLINSSYYRDGAVIQKYLKAAVKLLRPQVNPKSQDITPAPVTPTPDTAGDTTPSAGTTTSGGYRPVEGTNEDPYVKGTSGQGIFKVQECLGIKADGKFGPITHGKLMELAKPYRNGFTNDDITDICKMANPRREPTIAPITAIPTQDKMVKSGIKTPTLAPAIDKTKLAPMKLSPLAPKAPVTPEKKGLFNRKK